MSKNEGTKLRSVEVRGKTFEVFVNDGGRFYTNAEGLSLSTWGYETLSALIEGLEKATKRAAVKVSIPVTQLVGSSARHITIHSRHQSNGDYLGKEHTTRGDVAFRQNQYTRNLYKRMNEAQVAEYALLYEAASEAASKRDAFLKAFEFDLRAKLQEAEKAAEEGK